MSLMQTCAEVESVIARARALFGATGAVDVPDTAGRITTAAATVTSARRRLADLSGAGVAGYRAMATASVPPLTTAASSDTTLTTQMTTAATLTQAGAARLDQIAATTAAITKAAPSAANAASQRVILSALRSQVEQAAQVVKSTQHQAAALAGQVRGLQYPKDIPAQPLDQDLPRSPAPGNDPPHGKDPRYWIDVDQLKYVPDGKLAPNGYVQVGPNLYHPLPGYPEGAPPPKPASRPLDADALTHVRPGQLGPSQTRELIPGWFTPVPVEGEVVGPPKQPIDIRDIIRVPRGSLAPYNYLEYLPGWFAPKTLDPPIIPRLDGKP